MIRIFIGVLFCLLFFSDFVVLTLGLGSVFAGWREMLSLLMIMWLLLRALASVTARGRLNLEVGRWLLVVLFFAFLYLLFGDLSASSARMFRALAVPVFIGMAVAIWAQAVSTEKKLRHVYWSVLAMSVLTGVYALYQYLTIASAEQFWYWPLLTAKGYELQPYNSMRDGLPRVSGFFTGTLEFSAVILNTAAMTLAVLLSGRNWSLIRRLLLSAAFLLLCGLIAIGSVRTAMIGLVCICSMLVAARMLRTAWLISLLGYVQFIGLTVAIFAYLSMGYTQDLSALDRERQWLHMYEVLSAASHGLWLWRGWPGPATLVRFVLAQPAGHLRFGRPADHGRVDPLVPQAGDDHRPGQGPCQRLEKRPGQLRDCQLPVLPEFVLFPVLYEQCCPLHIRDRGDGDHW
ncbi:hypothetical protein QIY50_17475 [Pseudomonas putida]|nr:hypothetical protein QIY50_17475 [Pseudomonas putida]